MVRYSFAAALALAVTVLATPLPQSGSNAPGAQNVGKGNGQQFITGQCLSDADCASACCASLQTGGGVCSAKAVANVAPKQGCGFGGSANAAAANSGSSSSSSSSGSTSSASTSGSTINQNAAGAANVGKGNGQQFITGQCLSDADCASGCCATLNGAGVCSAKAVANANGKQGCGFGAAGASSSGSGSNTGTAAAAAASGSSGSASSSSSAGSTVNQNAPGAQNVGKGNGQQFITGQCLSDADCASACCASLQTGGGVCSAKAVANVAPKQGCGFGAAGGSSSGSGSNTGTAAAAAASGSSGSTSSSSSAGSTVNQNAPGAQNVGKGTGQQFITGQCLSNADCASGCCASLQTGGGVCSAKAVANVAPKQGCGFTGTA